VTQLIDQLLLENIPLAGIDGLIFALACGIIV